MKGYLFFVLNDKKAKTKTEFAFASSKFKEKSRKLELNKNIGFKKNNEQLMNQVHCSDTA